MPGSFPGERKLTAVINNWKQSAAAQLLLAPPLLVKNKRHLAAGTCYETRQPAHRAAGGLSLLLICALTREEFPEVAPRVVLLVQLAGWAGRAGTGLAVGLGLREGSGQRGWPRQRGMHRSAMNPAPLNAVLQLLGKYPERAEGLGRFPNSQGISADFTLK